MTEQTRKGIISFSISDRGALYSSYMAFVQNGGLFVPTARNFELGDEVFMLLKIMDDHSFIDLPEGMPKAIFKDLKKVWVCGQKLQISRVDETSDNKPIKFSDTNKPLRQAAPADKKRSTAKSKKPAKTNSVKSSASKDSESESSNTLSVKGKSSGNRRVTRSRNINKKRPAKASD